MLLTIIVASVKDCTLAAKDKTPNRTLSIAIDMRCDSKDCNSHAVVTRTRDNGTIERKCLLHLNPQVDLLSKFLNLV